MNLARHPFSEGGMPASPSSGFVVVCTIIAMSMGGNVRTGLEDYAGPRQPSNPELVQEIVALARVVGRPVATPEQAARVIGLPRA